MLEGKAPHRIPLARADCKKKSTLVKGSLKQEGRGLGVRYTTGGGGKEKKKAASPSKGGGREKDHCFYSAARRKEFRESANCPTLTLRQTPAWATATKKKQPLPKGQSDSRTILIRYYEAAVQTRKKKNGVAPRRSTKGKRFEGIRRGNGPVHTDLL